MYRAESRIVMLMMQTQVLIQRERREAVTLPLTQIHFKHTQSLSPHFYLLRQRRPFDVNKTPGRVEMYIVHVCVWVCV